MDTLQGQLLAIGLSENEAAVMSVLITHSPASASLIAKKAGLSRSSVYTLLSALSQKGLVDTTEKNEVRQFIATDIEGFTTFLDDEADLLAKKTAALQPLRETLQAEAKDQLHVPDVSFFAGQTGLKRVYLHMLRNAREGECLYQLRDEFVWESEWEFIFSKEWSDRVSRLKDEKDISTKLLVNDSKREREHIARFRNRKAFEQRFLPPKHPLKGFSIYIIGDTVAVMSMEKGNLLGTLTVNQNIANNYTVLFAALWQSAKKT